MSAFDLYRDSAKTYKRADKVEPHRPVHTAKPNTCGVCKGLIGFHPADDPVHAVSGNCRCGVILPPFTYTCAACQMLDNERRERERLIRLGQYAPEPVTEASDDEDDDEREERTGGFNPEYVAAKRYASTYTGTFDFMLSMKDRVNGPKGVRGPLSPKMVEAILKCKKADEERAARAAKAQVERVQTGRNLTALPEGRTYAAVDNDSGAVTFLIIDRPGEKDRHGFPNKWAGWVFVKQQLGDEEVRLGSQRPGETYSGQWANLIDKVLADPTAAVMRYGLELGVCGVCGRTLTNEESREKGIGPVCLAKLESGL